LPPTLRVVNIQPGFVLTEKTGIKVETRWNVAGADVLSMHNAGNSS
jgi:hypothetical protein